MTESETTELPPPESPPVAKRKHRWVLELAIIIGLLVFLTWGNMPRRGGPRGSVTHIRARKTCTDVINAIKQFYSEYEVYPVDTGAAREDMELTTADTQLMKTLWGKNPERNPKNLNFLDGLKEARKGSNGMEDGLDFTANPDAPTLLDPWGTPYRLIFDSNFDSEIANPDKTKGGLPVKSAKAIMWSAGKDRNFDTWEDNQKSW